MFFNVNYFNHFIMVFRSDVGDLYAQFDLMNRQLYFFFYIYRKPNLTWIKPVVCAQHLYISEFLNKQWTK